MAQDRFGSLSVDTDGTVPMYTASIVGLVPAALATDIFTLVGSSTMRVRVQYLRVTATQTTGGAVNVLVVARSTPNTGGTATQPTVVPFDSRSPAGTAVVNAYTANPTTGTLAGAVFSDKMYLQAPAAVTVGDHLILSAKEIKAPVLNSANESMSLNLNGVTVTGGLFNITIMWTEEPLNG